MQYKDFEDFLSQQFANGDGKCCLDDYFPDSFSDWLVNLEIEDWLKYGDMYKKEQ